MTLLEYSIAMKCLPAAKILLKAGAGILSNLELACSSGYADMVNLLLQYSANPMELSANTIATFSPQIQKIINDAILAEKLRKMDPLQAAAFVVENVGADLSPLKSYVLANPLKIDDQITFDPTIPEASLLYKAARSGNGPAVEFLLQNNANVGIQGAAQNTPLHVATYRGHVPVVGALIEGGSDVNKRNKSGELPDSLFEAKVPETSKSEIRRLYSDERKRIEEDKKKQQLMDYLQSLPTRKIDNSSGIYLKATVFWTNAMAHAKPITEDALKKVLGGLVMTCIQDHLNHDAKTNSANDNPVSRELFKKAAELCNQEFQSNFQNFEDFLNVPAPNLIPEKFQAQFPIQATNFVNRASKAFFEELFDKHGGLLPVPALQTALKDFLAENKSKSLGPELAVKLSDKIKELCIGHIKQCATNSTFIKCIARTFILQKSLASLSEEFSNSILIFPRASLIKACDPDSNNTITKAIFAVKNPTAEDFLGTLVAAGTFPTEILKDVNAVISGAGSPFMKLNKVDNLVLQKFSPITTAKVWAHLKSQVDPDELASGTCQEFFDGIISDLVKSASSEYSQAGTVLTAGNQLLKSLPYEQTVFEPKLTDKLIVETFFQNRRATPPAGCHGGPTGPNAARYASKISEIQKELKFPMTIPQLVSKFLRNAHLNFVWCEVVAYSKLDVVLTAVQANDVILIEAGTGSGKSTIVPQFLCHELGWRVLVTQPRREPTTSIGNFVEKQFGKKRVGFQVGGSKNPFPGAKLQYMTDALYLGKALTDPIPNDTIIVIDEVHERSSVMDLVLLVLLHKRKIPGSNFKIALASATVDPSWFQQMCAYKDLQAKFVHINLPVFAPHPVTPKLPPAGLLTWPAPAKGGPDRAMIAAKDAFSIASTNPQARVLVFLPNITEILKAESDFRGISGGLVSCAAIYAAATGVSQKLQTARVIFSNNIAETSLTVPKLSHVLDFNLSVVAKVDPICDKKELEVVLCTLSSYTQRKGRLGRVCPGTYVGYYVDAPSQAKTPSAVGSGAALKTTQRCGFEILSNDHLLQMEMRVRHYLKRTLFVSSDPALKSLGPGIPLREITKAPNPIPITSLLPKTPKHLEIAAVLNLTASLAVSLGYALDNKKSALAILWLSAILESRESPTPFGVPLPQQFATGLGASGDFGVVLEVFKKYTVDKANSASSSFDVNTWCANNGQISPLFIKIVEERVGVVMGLCDTVLGIDTTRLTPPSNWTADDLALSLLAGHWRHTLKRVDHKWRTDLAGPYRQLDSTQQNGLKLSTSSIWFNSSSGTVPEYVLYRSMDSKDTASWVSYLMTVGEKQVEEITKHEKVTQSIGLFWFQYKDAQPWIEANKGLFAKVVVKAQGQGQGQAALPFSAEIQARYKAAASNLYCELVVTGTRVEVGKVMDKAVEEITNAIALAQVMSQNPATIGGGISKPVSIADLQNIDPAMAKRLRDAVCPRTHQDLTQALASGNMQTIGLALCNILVNDFQCSPKGGIVRDLIVLNKNSFADVDMNLMKSLTPSNWKTDINKMCQEFKKKYNFNVVYTSSRTGANGQPDGMIVLKDSSGIEFEMVAPWNTPFYTPTAMDMTVNNLCLLPSSQNIEPIVHIGMPCVGVVRQLMVKPKPQSSPLYNITWIAGSGGKTGEGISRNMWVEASASSAHDRSIMDGRLKKMRQKGYWLVEAAHATGSGSYVLYHGTSPSSAQAILSSQQLKPGSGGNLGPGVYMSRDTTICKMFGTHILSATVHPGKVENVKSWCGTSWHALNNADTAFMSAADSPRHLEEWCIRRPSNAQITGIKQVTP